MNYNGLPLFDIDIKDDDDGVKIMSLVDSPAVEKNFLKFSKENLNFNYNDEKQVVTGVALRANYPIYRKDGDREFYVRFSSDTIEKIVHKFMREERVSSVNINHKKDVDGIYLFESFILSDNHKLTFDEFKDVENGSWMVSYKVEDGKIWDEIKSGGLNGFSVEVDCELKEDFSKEELLYTLNYLL